MSPAESMRALVLYGPHDLRVERVESPRPQDGEVLLRVTGAGVCGSDAALFMAGNEAIPPRERGVFPVVPGHEFAGRVVAAAPGVPFAEGDLVASGAGISCGRCDRCLAGRTNLCRAYRTAGVYRHGGLAEYVAIPASTCVRATDHGVSGDDAALAQPMAIARHALVRGRLGAGDRVLVIGVGGIGAFIVWAASRAGAEVTACDPVSERLDLARELGAVAVVDVGSGPELLEQVGPEDRWDLVMEVSGSDAGFQAALGVIERGGRIVLVGTQKQPRNVDLSAVTRGEVDLLGTHAHVCATDLPAALELLAARSQGWADVAPEAIPLESVVAEALEPMLAGRPGRIKTLVDPAASRSRPYARDDGAGA